MKSRYTAWIIAMLVGAWTILVLSHFFQNFPLIHLPEILLNGAAIGILVLFFTAVGRRVLRYLPVAFPSFAEECCVSFGLGTGIIIGVLILLAAIGLVYKLLIVLVMLGLAALVYGEAKAICLRGYAAWSKDSFRSLSGVEVVWLLLMGVAAAITFLAAATPPYFFDALVYHLAVPQRYLLHHGFQYLPYHHFSNFPMNLGMLFLVGLSLSGGILAKLISWMFAPMTAIAIYSFAISRWGRQVALAAAAICFLVPGVLILSTLTAIDLGVMFYSFLSFTALLSWFSTRQRSWFVLAGVFCSLAVGSKYTALVTTLLPLLLILGVHELLTHTPRVWAGVRATILLGVIVLVGMSPWLIKNTLYTGNPVYPLFNSLIGTKVSHEYTYYEQKLSRTNPLYALLQDENADGSRWAEIGEVSLSALKAPWTVTMTTTRAAGKTGVLFLLCLPWVLLIKKMDTFSRYLLALGVCAFWLWVILLPQTALRYVFQMFPPFSLVTAYVLWQLPVSERQKTLISGGIGLLLIYHLCFLGGALTTLRPFTYLFSNQSQEEFLVDHGVTYYPAIQYINYETLPDAKILYVGEIRGYYCERDFLLATDAYRVDEAIILRQLIVESESVPEVVEKLRDRGITHLLMNLAEMARFAKNDLKRESYFGFPTAQDQQRLERLLSPQYVRLLVSQHQVNVYELR
ncbi:phospholipid carrier-dependent glycosyltransferase [candidate division KSB3 bacterium]|uniref:Phospholipid carrier-dependent glycosyltransferase n=1 Tax=candidate division KSB3 bacterium TaxID=2044937 RepID=A0A9D5Q7C5_9BACT|nr:phospholipid carrier-dependent glycosyltransferase [candidate division KSB3 bacterium]MBD3326157.1 phospholipid carrier-dependent glycosyltransferase [candidate division KSB3 bacterium]